MVPGVEVVDAFVGVQEQQHWFEQLAVDLAL